MMISGTWENVRVAGTQLRSSKLRTALTMLGIIIGIASVVVLLSLGQGVQNYITSQFESLGASLIRVSALSVSGVTEPLTAELVEALNDPARAPDIAVAMPQTQSNLAVVAGGDDTSVSVYGATTDYLNVNDRSVSVGRFFTDAEADDSARVAVLGVTTAEDLFGSVENAVGQQLRIRSVYFEVIGVLNDTGEDSDEAVVVPITTSQTRLNASRTLDGKPVINTILIKATDSEQVDAAVEQATRILREERGIGSGDSDNFNVFTASTILDSLTETIGTLTAFLGVLAGISLLVGGIGVMNIMLVTVNERTREIGLRKAVGARRTDIIAQFLTEAVVMTLLGGLIGIVLAASVALLITALIDSFTIAVQPSSVALAMTISLAVGLFFGVYPAGRAARLNPIDALRYE